MGGVSKKLTNNLGRAQMGITTGGVSELARLAPQNTFVGRLGRIPDALTGNLGDHNLNSPQYGPLQFDPSQLAADQAAISGLGQSQYDQSNKFIDSDQQARQSARGQLADALTKQSQASFQQALPQTLEDLNARKLLNGSGVGQELARQQGNIATNIANQVGTLGAGDIDHASQMRSAALGGLQGTQTSGLQRKLQLEDFINQANMSRQLGHEFTPQNNNGKANTGALLQGVGALAPWGKVGKAASAIAPPVAPPTPPMPPKLPNTAYAGYSA